MEKKMDVRLLSQMALLTALMLVMAFTPLGYIPLPFMNATTMHIPVIIGACLLGPKMGGILGGLFGMTSVLKATITPNLTSFVFTPFYSFSPETVSLAIAGFVGSLVNTIGVMGLIYLLFGEQYAAAGGTSPELLLGVIIGVVGMNGVPEAIIAAVLTAAVCKALLAVTRRSMTRA